MCDTIVAVPPSTADGAVWFGKNSDREPGEAQVVEHLPRRSHPAPTTLHCTYLEIPQADLTHEVVISRPFWMWGAEMGVNEHGLAIGNEAVFTRLPVAKVGLTGMDLLRLALERATSSREALDLITHLLARYDQGGGCGFRHRGFRYHNSYIITDPNEAWVLETAGPFWAAERVRGIRTISNCLSIHTHFDLIHPHAFAFARDKGWCRAAADFDFARCFRDPFYSLLAGGDGRRACTMRVLGRKNGGVDRDDFFAALTDHAGVSPDRGWRMKMPCAHSSWWPTRQAGQTTGSMVSRLHPRASTHWLTGTSSPCLSVFKPVTMGGSLLSTGPQPGEGYNQTSLFWRHERLHRLVLEDYEPRSAIFEDERIKLQAKIISSPDSTVPDKLCQQHWDEHLVTIPSWADKVINQTRPKRPTSLFNRYWDQQKIQDKFPSIRLQ